MNGGSHGGSRGEGLRGLRISGCDVLNGSVNLENRRKQIDIT